MTAPQRHGGRLLLVLGVALVAYGLAEQRDAVVATGALLAAVAVALDRLAPPRGSPRAVIAAQLRDELEARIAERLRRVRA